MKKSKLFLAAAGLSACVLYASCIGSFGLFNKFAAWNVNATKYKIVNGIIGIILSPVYGICLTADWIVLNTIEFWTGKPLLASVGETRHVVGSDGNAYVIVTEEDGYRIENATQGGEMRMVFDEGDQTWSLAQDDEERKLVRLNDDKTLTVFAPDGRQVTVANDEEGLAQVRDMFGPVAPFISAQ